MSAACETTVKVGDWVRVTCSTCWGSRQRVEAIIPSAYHGMDLPLYRMANGQHLDRSEFEPTR
jgi:hypothetical protein